jgi:ribosomal protein S18 acetylase RimI-like enzyme
MGPMDMESATVRLATPADIPAIVTRWRELMRTHAQLDPELYRLAPGAADTYAAFVRRRLGDRQTAAFVAPDGDGDIAGYILGGIGHRAPIFEVQQVGMIFDLAVRPDRRRAGIGRALVDALAMWFERRDVRWLQVNYSPDNPLAAGFWTGVGFRTLLIEAYRAPEDF